MILNICNKQRKLMKKCFLLSNPITYWFLDIGNKYAASLVIRNVKQMTYGLNYSTKTYKLNILTLYGGKGSTLMFI